MKWTIYALLGIVIALIPCALYAEYIIPFSVWEEWARWHDHETVSYSGANPPPALRVIEPVFTAIVLPPTWVAEHLGAHRGLYGYYAASYAGLVPLGGSFHYDPPALIAASEFLIFGIPFWSAVTALVGQSIVWARRRAT
ncbi:MAG TPA: hypothetical protein VLC46_12180 [Thermoanaerobaculia bacterium]|jgi:hypothetical protein|nr:hypothetical protein [Thermoanaerobaculia bacterium]